MGMPLENFLVDNNSHEGVDELQLAQFRKLGKLYLPHKYDEENNGAWLNRGNAFYLLVKPKHYDELFLVFDKAPYFWIYDSPFIRYIRSFFRITNTVKNESNGILEFLNYYSKWVLGKSAEEKRFYANSAIDVMIKRKFTKHFMGQVLESVIYIFEESQNNKMLAVDLLESSMGKISSLKMPPDIESEMMYSLTLFLGFAQLKLESYDIAEDTFSRALSYKPDGINAKFYLSLTSAKLHNDHVTNNLINELYDYDLARVSYAMEINNSKLFNAYCFENIIQNIFRYEDYLSVIDLLSSEIGIRISKADLLYASLKAKLIDFNNIDFKSAIEKKNIASLRFIEEILKQHTVKNNIIFLSSMTLIEEKFYSAVYSIIKMISDKYESEIQTALAAHDVQIQEGQDIIMQIKGEIESTKISLAQKYEKAINNFKETTKNNILHLEDRIANLASQSEYNIFTVFKNNMFYNIFFALIVLLIVGFANYSNNYISEISNMNKIVSSFILTGSKWGIISFVMGAIFSLIHLLTVITERNSQKQILLKKIEKVKKQSEHEIQLIMKEKEETEKTAIKKLNEKIEFNEARIKNLILERKKEEEEIRVKYKKEIDRETVPLKGFLPK